MSSVQQIAKNTLVLFVGDLIFKIMSLFITIYLAKYLGVENFGKYNFVFAFLALFGILKNLGLHDILARDLAQNPTIVPKLIGNAYFVKIIMTLVAIVLCTITISLLHYSKEITNYVYVASIIILFTSFSDFYSVIFQVNYKSEYQVFANLIFKIASTILILFVIFSHGTLMQIFIVTVFSEMLKTYISYSFSKKFVKPQFEIDYKLWKYFAHEATPIALASVISVINFRTDVIMLSAMNGNFAVGIYSAAHKIVEPLSLITFAFVVPLFPHMASSFKESKNKLIKTYKLSMRYLYIMFVPMVIGITLMADEIILMVYKEPFTESINVLQILIWTFIFSGNIVFVKLLITINKQKCIAKSMTISAIFNVIVNYALIPLFSYNGASIATLLSSLLVFTMNYHHIGKHLTRLPLHEFIIKPAIGGLVMAVYLNYITDNIILMITGGFLIYCTMLIILKTFNDEDREIFKKIITLDRFI